MEKVYNRIPKKHIDYLYLAAFTLVLVYDYAFLTRFDREPFRIPYIVGAALAGAVLVLRMFNIKNESIIGIIFATSILLIGAGYLLVRHSFYFLVLAMLITGALRVDSKKILTVYLLVCVVFFAVMLINFLLKNIWWKNDSMVHFGSINSTDCQGMVFFLLAAYLFYKGRSVRYIEILVFGIIVLWFWHYTRAELNMYCSIALLVITGIMKCGTSLKFEARLKPNLIMGYIISASFLICAVVIIVLAIRYDPNNEKWQTINLALHKRLETPHKMYLLYPPSVWGSEFVQVGWGYSPGVDISELYTQYGYTYIDSSYPNILINHGFLVFTLIIGAMTIVSLRYAKKGDLYRVLILSVLAIEFVAEGHLKDISCNVWLLLPLAFYEDMDTTFSKS